MTLLPKTPALWITSRVCEIFTMGPYFIESFNKPYQDISCSVHAYFLVVPPTSLTLPNPATSTHDMNLVKGVHDLQQRLPDFC